MAYFQDSLLGWVNFKAEVQWRAANPVSVHAVRRPLE
jgi:hypothetical protein